MSRTQSAGIPDDRALAAATLLSILSPARLETALSRWPDPVTALRALGGRVPPGLARTLEHRGTRVLVAGDAGYPITEDLPRRPPVLLLEGDRPEVLDVPRVAVVGTRAATPHGLADARHLGAFLTSAGISVVSGMAIGIDGEAHLGALSVAETGGGRAGPVGVIATGMDVVYPRRHTILFDRVRHHGVLVSESTFGTTPSPGRFPVRNRIIAALADVVVVVEATLTGGSRITAERALDYGRPVFAIPGSRRNPAAAGCNTLLADGAHPLLDPSDLLLALGMTSRLDRGWSAPTPSSRLSSAAATVERALGGEPAHPDQLASRTNLDPGQVAVAVEELVAHGSVKRDRGFIWPL